jgi:3-oxoacyl-[acyl-carrier protein] reductase
MVTGGVRGLGLAVADAFSHDGDRVVVTYVHKPVDRHWSIRCDQRSGEDVDRTFTQVEREWGPVDVVVCNAGIVRDNLLIAMPEEDWTATLATNLVGSWRIARRALRAMGGGNRERARRIVFVSSVSAAMGRIGQGAYSASKAGLVGLAQALARDVAPAGITVNVVAPGAIATGLGSTLTQDQRDELRRIIPLGRRGTGEEVAAVIHFLASPAASYITGAVVTVDGGLSMGR